MCHLVRDEHALARPEGRGALPDGEGRRARWLVGAAVTMAAGLAIAGWFDLRPESAPTQQQVTQAAAAPVPPDTLRAAPGSAGGVQFAADEVPTAQGEARKSAGHCEYGL